MNLKEVLPAFIWASVVVGGTSLALAWLSSGHEVNDFNYHGDEAFLVISPYDH